MAVQRMSSLEILIERLDRELIARGAQVPNDIKLQFMDKEGTPERDAIMARALELYDNTSQIYLDKALSNISTMDLVKMLIIKTREISGSRGIWQIDDRLDFCDISGERVKKNARCVAAILSKHDLIDEKGFSTLKVKNYGKTFNLCAQEPFYYQPIVAGRVSTGFLVGEDIIATSGHSATASNVTELRIVFGFSMVEPGKAVTQVSNENIYKGVKIIHRTYSRMDSGQDWALLKLDRKVEGRTFAMLSQRNIARGNSIYVIGHPLGLPVKYAPGAFVCDIGMNYFMADLDVFMGNPGSPVFDSGTDEVIGLVVRCHEMDFRWTGNCWRSIIYHNRDVYSKGTQCTRVSEFIKYCQ